MDHLRWASERDHAALGQIMYDAVHHGSSRYTAAQRAAWVPKVPGGAEWSGTLAAQKVAVADRDGAPVGFMTLTDAGYVNLAYVAPRAQRSGVFRALFAMIEAAARDARLPRLTAHASLIAQPAFLAMGFRVIGHETVPRGGQMLDRAEMEKRLT